MRPRVFSTAPIRSPTVGGIVISCNQTSGDWIGPKMYISVMDQHTPCYNRGGQSRSIDGHSVPRERQSINTIDAPTAPRGD